VAHTKLVENLGVQGRQIRNDDIHLVYPAIHDRFDTASKVGVDRPKIVHINLVTGQTNELLISHIEVQHTAGRIIGLVAKAGNDETGELPRQVSVCFHCLRTHRRLSLFGSNHCLLTEQPAASYYRSRGLSTLPQSLCCTTAF
jgi:hypothetical protein